MAGEYQRIKTPRLYVDLANWYKNTENKVPNWNTHYDENGQGFSGHDPAAWYGGQGTKNEFLEKGYNGVLFDMNPSTYVEINPQSANLTSLKGVVFTLPIPDYIPPDSDGKSQFYLALIGHNFKDAKFKIQVSQFDSNGNSFDVTTFGNVLNGSNNTYSGTNNGMFASGSPIIDPEYNGTTIVQLEDLAPTTGKDNYIQVKIATNMTGNQTFGYLGCLSYGTYYDLPHSPELSVSMGRMYDGMESIQTASGHDVVQTKFKGSPRWLMHPWDQPDEVFESYSGAGINQVYKDFYPTGRRTWTMNFNYLDESDVMPYVDTASHENAFIDAESGGLISDQASPGQYSLAGHPGFMNQVIQRTYGGNYPFIFQSNKDSMQSDAFAIVKFDAIPEFTQVANGVYSCSLSLREVW